MIISFVLLSYRFIIIIIIIIIIIWYRLYSGLLQLHAWDKPCFWVYNVAAVSWLQFMLHSVLFLMINFLYFYITPFRSTRTCAVPSMSVFCNSLMSCSPVVLLKYFLKDIEMFPVVPIISGVALVLYISHTLCLCCSGFRILRFYRLLPWSYSYLLKMQCLLTHMFLLLYPRLYFPVYC